MFGTRKIPPFSSSTLKTVEHNATPLNLTDVEHGLDAELRLLGVCCCSGNGFGESVKIGERNRYFWLAEKIAGGFCWIIPACIFKIEKIDSLRGVDEHVV